MRYLLLLSITFSFSLSAQIHDTIRFFFATNEFKLSNVEQIDLKGGLLVKLEAYCDTIGSVSYNKQLAKKRAAFIQNFLPKSETSNLQVKVIGEPNPTIARGHSDHFWRRVDLIIELPQVEEVIEIVEEKSSVVNETAEIINQFKSFIADSSQNEVKIDLTIRFFPGSASVLPEYEDQLWVLFDFLHVHDNLEAIIQGHVCCADDYPLSYQRAKMVYNFLTIRSISVQRLSYEGFSNSRPKVSPELTEKDRIQNRRVEVLFKKRNS